MAKYGMKRTEGWAVVSVVGSFKGGFYYSTNVYVSPVGQPVTVFLSAKTGALHCQARTCQVPPPAGCAHMKFVSEYIELNGLPLEDSPKIDWSIKPT